ncbi:MAG: prepilin-type N-terminal cleavage/methylation domain-containing protein [Candidatus Omnitrophota bacterium]
MIFSPRGLTLLEVLISLAIISILIVAVTFTALSVFRSWPTEAGHSEERLLAANALERMLREFRSSLRIVLAQSNQITFWLDSNDNGIEDTLTEDVNFSWSGVAGESLYLAEGAVSQEILKNINNFSIVYFDDNNQVLTTPINLSLVRLLEINLSNQIDEEVVNLRFKVKLRNL